MKDFSPDWILSGILAGAGFLVTYIAIGINLPLSLVLTGLCGASGMLIFQKKPALIQEKPADLESSLAEGRRKLAEIRAIAKLIKTSPSQIRVPNGIDGKIDAVCVTINKIFAEIRRDPEDLKRARQFLSYYLDSTITILKKYEKLSSQDIRDSGIAASLQRVISMLDTIDLAFEKQLAHLLSNDVMDLDTELSLLEKTIRMEGLGEE